MIAEYSHRRYELDGSVNTETFGAQFLFARKLIGEYQPPIPPHAQKRFIERIEPIASLSQFEIIYTDDIFDTENTPSLPRIAIFGSIILEDPIQVMSRISGAGIAALGQPVTPDIIERSLAESALDKCGRIIVSEFEGILVQRPEYKV